MCISHTCLRRLSSDSFPQIMRPARGIPTAPSTCHPSRSIKHARIEYHLAVSFSLFSRCSSRHIVSQHAPSSMLPILRQLSSHTCLMCPKSQFSLPSQSSSINSAMLMPVSFCTFSAYSINSCIAFASVRSCLICLISCNFSVMAVV